METIFFSSHNSLLKIVEEFKNNNNFDVIISDLAFKKILKNKKFTGIIKLNTLRHGCSE